MEFVVKFSENNGQFNANMGDWIRGPQGPQGEKGETGPAGKDAPQDVIRYSEQALTDAQQAQARANILAASAGEVGQLKDDLIDAKSRITGKMKVVESVSVWGKNEINDGYVSLNGVISTANTLYYMSLDVTAGDRLRLVRWNESDSKTYATNMRFVTTYDADGNPVPDKGSENTNNWIVPDGIVKVIITISKSLTYPCLMVNSTADPTEPILYFTPYYVADEGFVDEEKIIEKVKQEVTVTTGKTKVPPCVLENGLIWNTDSDKMVVTFTLGSTSDAIFVCANASGNGRTYYVNYSTGKIGNVKNNDMTVIPTAWGYFEDIAIPAVARRMYTLSINKVNGTTFEMTLTDLVTLEKQVFTDQHDQGSGNGVRVILTSGNPTVNNFVTMSTQSSNPFILLIGDSFIEGNQLTVQNKDKRYCALVRDNIAGDTFIYGLAGRNSTEITDAYYNQIKPICKPKYAFLEIGTNDRDYDTWLSNMQTLIADLVSDDIIPILCTLTPITDNPSGYNDSVMPNVNAWIKASGYKYVDFNAVLTSDGITQIADYFLSDGCHPNIDGNAVMYNKIREDVPELFC